MKRVLILCTGNSCRSQMAEALWNRIGGEEWHAESAGSKPSGYVHPLAIEVMGELGADISVCHSKGTDRFREETFEIVVTVCDSARNACPSFPGAAKTLHWPFDDPADATGTDAEKVEVFRRVRDQISDRISIYLQECSAG
jgi:arsenate reductase